MAKAPHSFDFYTANFIEAVRLFEPDEVGAYTLLLCHQWKHGFIPENDRQRMKAAQVSDVDQWSRIWETIRCKFEMVELDSIEGIDPGEQNRHVFANPRMYKDRNVHLPRYQAAVKRAQENGKKGGRKPKSVPKSVLSETDFHKGEGGRGKNNGAQPARKEDAIIYPHGQRLRTAFDKWREARFQKHNDWLDDIQAQQSLDKLRGYTETEAVAACEAAIEGGWRTLHPKRAENEPFVPVYEDAT